MLSAALSQACAADVEFKKPFNLGWTLGWDRPDPDAWNYPDKSVRVSFTLDEKGINGSRDEIPSWWSPEAAVNLKPLSQYVQLPVIGKGLEIDVKVGDLSSYSVPGGLYSGLKADDSAKNMSKPWELAGEVDISMEVKTDAQHIAGFYSLEMGTTFKNGLIIDISRPGTVPDAGGYQTIGMNLTAEGNPGDTKPAVSVEGKLDISLNNSAESYGLLLNSAKLNALKGVTEVHITDARSNAFGVFLQGNDNELNVTDLRVIAKNTNGQLNSGKANVGIALYGGASSVKLSSVTLDLGGMVSYGIWSMGQGGTDANTVTVSESAAIYSPTALYVLGKDSVTLERDFTAYGKKGDETAAMKLGVVNGGTININSTGAGVVNMTGTTHIPGSGTINIKLGSNSKTRSAETSKWTVTDASQVSKLTLTTGGVLNFKPQNGTFGTDGLISADDGNADDGASVVLNLKKGEAGKVAIDIGANTLDLTQGPVKLVKSTDGFEDAEGGDVNPQTNLWRLTEGLFVKSTPSVVRETVTDLSKEYGLKIIEEGSVEYLAAVDPSDAPGEPDAPEVTPDNPGVTPPSVEPEKPSTQSSVNSQTDALMESSLSAYGTLFASSDLLMDSVIRSRNGQHQEGPFAAARGGRWDYDTRSDLKADVVAGLFGAAKRIDQTEIGGFIEMGHVSYDTETHSELGNVDASGKQNYAGLGVYFNQALPVEALHLTGYVKTGVLRNKFDAPIAGRTEEFDRTSMYWGAHLGAYYDMNVASWRTRTFLSYFYDGRDSEDYDLAGHDNMRGAHLDYDGLNGHRVQIGAFAEYDTATAFRPYFGLSFERVLSAKAEGTATDDQGSLALRTSDMEGSTGIVSVGWTSGDATDEGFTMEAGLNGYFGARRGVSAQMQANWKF